MFFFLGMFLMFSLKINIPYDALQMAERQQSVDHGAKWSALTEKPQ